MEYIAYVLIVTALLGLCAYGLWSLRQEESLERSLRRVPAKGAGDTKGAGLEQAAAIQQRELQKVPTPWGWPGNAGGNDAPAAYAKSNGHSGLHHWVDHLVSEKQTIDDQAYRQKREASMRALLEDRFYSSNHAAEIKYRKTKPPLLRDPSEPHDQMDNFPSGRLDKIQAGLHHQNGTRRIGQQGLKFPENGQLSDVRTPWGW